MLPLVRPLAHGRRRGNGVVSDDFVQTIGKVCEHRQIDSAELFAGIAGFTSKHLPSSALAPHTAAYGVMLNTLTGDAEHRNSEEMRVNVSLGRDVLLILRLPREKGGDQWHRPRVKEREAYMFARHVMLQLKPNVAKEFPAVFEKEVLPLLRRQKGFRDELLLITPEKKEVVAISLWETKEYAETYNRELYPQIEKIVARFIEGIPVVKKFEAEYSTFHKTAFAAVV